MDARGMMRTAIGPAQLPPQLAEDAAHLVVTQWQAMQPSQAATWVNDEPLASRRLAIVWRSKCERVYGNPARA